MRVSGTHHMREVLGSEAASLLDGKKETKMLDHVIHKCLSLTPGLWDEDAEKFDTSDPVAFSVLLLRQRTYGRDKITPVALTGDEDEEFQQQFVMDSASGERKLLTKGRRVDGRMLMSQCSVPTTSARRVTARRPCCVSRPTTRATAQVPPPRLRRHAARGGGAGRR